MAVAQLLLSMEPKYICHNQCTMDTSSPIVPKLSTEILLIPAILELYHIPPLNLTAVVTVVTTFFGTGCSNKVWVKYHKLGWVQ